MASSLRRTADQFFSLNLRIRSDETKRQYRYALQNLAEHLGRPGTLDDLTDDNICGMMRVLLDRGLAPKTINDRRDRINSLWRWCAKRKLVDEWPTNAPLMSPHRTPIGWLPEELARLLASCRLQQGCYEGISAWRWWTSLHHAAFDTAERIGALLQAEWSHLHDGHLCLPADVRKGGRKDAVSLLSPDTLKLIDAIRRPERKLLWPWSRHSSRLYQVYGQILDRAKLPNDRRHKFHAMRVTVISMIQRVGGDATAAAQHSDPRTTREHYFDPRLTGQRAPWEMVGQLDEVAELPGVDTSYTHR